MKYLKRYNEKIGADVTSKITNNYEIGDYVIVNYPKMDIYNDILKITDVRSYLGNNYWYTCSIRNDDGKYDVGLSIDIPEKKIKKKLSKEEVQFLLDTIKYNL